MNTLKENMASLELTGRLLVLYGEGFIMFDIIVNSFCSELLINRQSRP